jgi:hypothetical protein
MTILVIAYVYLAQRPAIFVDNSPITTRGWLSRLNRNPSHPIFSRVKPTVYHTAKLAYFLSPVYCRHFLSFGWFATVASHVYTYMTPIAILFSPASASFLAAIGVFHCFGPVSNKIKGLRKMTG